jgi:hypothetical protein
MVYSRLISRITLVSRVLMRIFHESCNGRNSHALGCQGSYTILENAKQAPMHWEG